MNFLKVLCSSSPNKHSSQNWQVILWSGYWLSWKKKKQTDFVRLLSFCSCMHVKGGIWNQKDFPLSLQHKNETDYLLVFHPCNFIDHILCNPSFEVVDEMSYCTVWHDTLVTCTEHCVNSNVLDKLAKRC